MFFPLKRLLALALAQRFSQGVVNIKTHTVTFPHVRLEPGKVVVVVDSRIDAFVSVSPQHPLTFPFENANFFSSPTGIEGF